MIVAIELARRAPPAEVADRRRLRRAQRAAGARVPQSVKGDPAAPAAAWHLRARTQILEEPERARLADRPPLPLRLPSRKQVAVTRPRRRGERLERGAESCRRRDLVGLDRLRVDDL